MRIVSLSVKDMPPVKWFAAEDLADVVVIAGPNGVGKTRLARTIIDALAGGAGNFAARIAATDSEEEGAWGKNLLDLSTVDDRNKFTTTLQANRRRRNLKSSILNFESDRSIQNIQPLSFSWDFADPDEEMLGWNSTFGLMRDRFQDTVHSLYRLIESQKKKIANRAIELRRQGKDRMNLNFSDPMVPFKEIFSRLVSPKQMSDLSAQQQRLEYENEGVTFDFSTLSSGEREVVNIAFDFLLRKPQDCIVFFDEPELHLHPELSYRLIQTLQSIGSNNQFILCTHSPDIITASLDHSVIFVTPPGFDENGAPLNQAVKVSEADETNRALRLLGQSIGIISLGKKIVLIEGEQSSLDKQVYGSLLANKFPGLVLVPSGGKHTIQSFAAVHEAVLSRSIWGVEFFMLCDGDSSGTLLSTETVPTEGRFRVLPRYHIENFFLDENVWAQAFVKLEPDGSWLRSPDQIREKIRNLASDMTSYAVALAVSTQLRQAVGNLDVCQRTVTVRLTMS